MNDRDQNHDRNPSEAEQTRQVNEQIREQEFPESQLREADQPERSTTDANQQVSRDAQPRQTDEADEPRSPRKPTATYLQQGIVPQEENRPER
jgi:hypothetical protein